MKKLLSLFLLFTSCQVLGIKETDTIQQTEMKVLDKVEDEIGITHDAEPPYAVSPIDVK